MFHSKAVETCTVPRGHVRSGTSGRRRAHFYACSSYHLRGTSVCKNRLMDPMARVDTAILSAFQAQLFADGVIEEVIDAALAQLAHAREAGHDDEAGAAQALAQVDEEIENLTAALAAGGEMTSLIKALKVREEERERLRRQVVNAAVAERRASATPTKLRQELTARFAEWRDVLRRQPAQARQILRKLLDGPLRLTPRDGYHTFEGTVSFAKVFGSAGLPMELASPPGFAH